MFRGIRDFVKEIERPQRLERRTRTHRAAGRAGLRSDASTGCSAPSGGSPSASAALWDDHDVLLMPMLAEPAVPAQLMEGRGATVTYLWESGWVPFSVLWNSTGQPAASVPAGFAADGLPLAVQLVGRPHGEGTLLTLSAGDRAGAPVGTSPPARRSLASVRRRMAGCRICSGDLELKVQGEGVAVTAAALSPSAHAVGGHGDLLACVECGTVQQPILPQGAELHDLYRDMRDDDYLSDRVQGVIAFWVSRISPSSAAAISTARPPATTTFDL